MHEDDDGTQSSRYDTPTSSHISTWSFPEVQPQAPEASPSRPRPRLGARHSSLPPSLFGSGSTSIFGSGSANMEQDRTQQDDDPPRPPLLSVEPPSQERVTQVAVPDSRALLPRDVWYNEANRLPATMVQRAEKDSDDPTAESSTFRRRETATGATLSKLFTAQIPGSPGASRSSSYVLQNRPFTSYARNVPSSGTAALPDHLYTRGLLEGRHSDITVNAFGHQYKLHRLILDRAPFFRSALSEPWLESSAKETTVHPEDIDASITKNSFELALKRLYGYPDLAEGDADAVGLFATGCWLEMQDLIDCSVESMLRHMTPEKLSPLIKLVTSNYYGRAGDKILASAKAMLCRDGWRMPLRYWDGVPGDTIREIVGGDGFFIDGEWERWVLAKRILDRRLRRAARDVGLVDPTNRRRLQKVPQTVNMMAVRFDAVYRKNGAGSGHGIPDSLHDWIALYTHPDVEPLLVLLDEGIHYVHLDFEQLQFIRKARDVVGLPVMPEKVISNALWQQMELRQKVMNTSETELELGLSVSTASNAALDTVSGASRDTTMSIGTPTSPPLPAKGKHRATDSADIPEDPAEDEIDSNSWDGNAKPRKFWIPSSDCNIVMGGNADPLIQTSNTTTIQRHASRHSATIEPSDVQWASDFAAATAQPRPHSSGGPGQRLDASGEVRYSHLPPFRFAAEFPNPRLLKEKKRVYSRTVFYAGSLWNIYIQKVASTRRKQLGVYLHRAKEREAEKVISGTAGVAQGSVDERIGQLEREMIMRSERRERNQRRRTEDGGESAGSATEIDFGSEPDLNPNDPATQAALARASTMRNLLSRKSGPADTSPSDSLPFYAGTLDLSDSDDSEEQDVELLRASQKAHVPALPPYVDQRPTIKTYFKIYSPSRQGRMLSVYESAPDTFNFSQSWGWMSSTLMVDEGILDDGDDNPVADPASEGGGSDAGGAKVGERPGVMKGKGDGKLRFMVVIGNV